jgi:hypothetical protein
MDKAAPKQRIQQSIPPHPGSRGSDGAGTEACFSGGGPCRKSVTAAVLDSVCRKEKEGEEGERERKEEREVRQRTGERHRKERRRLVVVHTALE